VSQLLHVLWFFHLLHVFLHYYREHSQSWFNYHFLYLVNRLWSKQAKDFDERYGHPDPVTSDRSFVEKPFGATYVDCDDSVASSIVSLALFDGNYAS
jgi:hypothetical protein